MILDEQTAFAIYRLPATDKVHLIAGSAQAITDPTEVLGKASGFMASPFKSNSNNTPYLISNEINKEISTQDISDLLSGIILLTDTSSIKVSTKEEYDQQIDHIKSAIASGRIEKAILSRIELIDHQDDKLADEFKALCDRYPHVMVSLVHIPGKFTWLTATPEILISTDKDRLTTVSLAGTQLDQGLPLDEVSWGDKEQDEQQIVSDYIAGLLNEHISDKVTIKGPNTISTGQVLHLKTTFNAQMDDKTRLGDFLNAMHPTPAVCGKPKQAAMDLIHEVEQHDRSYYAGYIGPVNITDRTQLFVNLRCMQVFQGKAALYLGGGITAGSDADLEWQETNIKADTLLKVLNNRA